MKHADSPFKTTRCTRCGTAFDIAPGVETECPKCGCLKKVAPQSGWGITEWGLLFCVSFLAGVWVLVSASNAARATPNGQASLWSHVGGAVLTASIAVSILSAYLAPAYVAFKRRSVHLAPIAVANLVFGWTVVVWGLCLVYAIVSPKRET